MSTTRMRDISYDVRVQPSSAGSKSNSSSMRTAFFMSFVAPRCTFLAVLKRMSRPPLMSVMN